MRLKFAVAALAPASGTGEWHRRGGLPGADEPATRTWDVAGDFVPVKGERGWWRDPASPSPRLGYVGIPGPLPLPARDDGARPPGTSPRSAGFAEPCHGGGRPTCRRSCRVAVGGAALPAAAVEPRRRQMDPWVTRTPFLGLSLVTFSEI